MVISGFKLMKKKNKNKIDKNKEIIMILTYVFWVNLFYFYKGFVWILRLEITTSNRLVKWILWYFWKFDFKDYLLNWRAKIYIFRSDRTSSGSVWLFPTMNTYKKFLMMQLRINNFRNFVDNNFVVAFLAKIHCPWN